MNGEEHIRKLISEILDVNCPKAEKVEALFNVVGLIVELEKVKKE